MSSAANGKGVCSISVTSFASQCAFITPVAVCREIPWRRDPLALLGGQDPAAVDELKLVRPLPAPPEPRSGKDERMKEPLATEVVGCIIQAVAAAPKAALEGKHGLE